MSCDAGSAQQGVVCRQAHEGKAAGRLLFCTVCTACTCLSVLQVNAERWAYALAVLAAALTWQLLEPAEASAWGASLVVRCTASGVSGLAVLLWRVLVSE